MIGTTSHAKCKLAITNHFPSNVRIKKQAKELRSLESMPLNDLRELYGQPKLLTKRESEDKRLKDLRNAIHYG